MKTDDLIELWNNNKEGVISYIKKKTNKADIVDDILQEVFIKFWEKYQTIKDKNKLLQWLLSVTRFTIADYFREKQRDNLKQDSIGNCDCQTLDEENSSVKDESKKLLPIIHSLPKKYANILLLADIHGFPYKVIAEQFELTIACIKKRVERGRKLLAQKMYDCCVFAYDKYGNIIDCSEKSEYLKIFKNLKD